jgi:hypothetical protein
MTNEVDMTTDTDWTPDVDMDGTPDMEVINDVDMVGTPDIDRTNYVNMTNDTENEHIFFWCSHGTSLQPDQTDETRSLRTYKAPFSNVSNIRMYVDNGIALYPPKFMDDIRSSTRTFGNIEYNLTYKDIYDLFNGNYEQYDLTDNRRTICDPSTKPTPVSFCVIDSNNPPNKVLVNKIQNKYYIFNPSNQNQTQFYNLPPMVFDAYDYDANTITYKVMMGLWHLDTKTEIVTRIMDINDVIEATKKNVYITYDYIRVKMAGYIEKNKGLFNQPYNIGFGIYACRMYDPILFNPKNVLPITLNAEYEQFKETIKLEDRICNDMCINEFYGYNRLRNKNTKIKKNIYFTPAVISPEINIPTNNILNLINFLKNRWNTILNITRQGCAYNVLSYWGLISTEISTEKIVCLTQGTSIFEIIRNLIIIMKVPDTIKFGVLRFNFNSLPEYLVSITNYTNKIIIVKLYYNEIKELPFNKNNNEPYDRGHTISFLYTKIINEELIYFIDPQMQLYELIFHNKKPTKSFNNWITNTPVKVFDTIYLVSNTDYPENNAILYKYGSTTLKLQGNQATQFELIGYNPDVIHGGNHKFTLLKKHTKSHKYKQIGSSNETQNISDYLANFPVVEVDQATYDNATISNPLIIGGKKNKLNYSKKKISKKYTQKRKNVSKKYTHKRKKISKKHTHKRKKI